MWFWDAVGTLGPVQIALFMAALLVAFGFEFINGFHDTANAVTTVIYTRTLKPTPAVLFSGFLNFLGVLLGGTAVAFGIINLLPVDLLVDTGASNASLVMVMSLLLAGVTWNLSTWYLGLPVSSSHTLIGSILGIGLANSLLRNEWALNSSAVSKVGVGLLVSPLVGFLTAALLLLLMKRVLREPRLYVPPEGDDRPPGWVRGLLVITCGGVSFAHGSNDGQKGMGLILLVLIGFLPFHYALDLADDTKAAEVHAAVLDVRAAAAAGKRSLPPEVADDLDRIERETAGKQGFAEIAPADRWELRRSIFRVDKYLGADAHLGEAAAPARKALADSIQFVPLWVVVGVALALGVGTTIGYKRIVVTVAEKIGKTHLTYAQGAAAEVVAAGTILAADFAHLPVSTTQVLSSGVAGTMAANGSGVQGGTCRKILLAWVLTLPASMGLSAGLFLFGRWLVG